MESVLDHIKNQYIFFRTHIKRSHEIYIIHNERRGIGLPVFQAEFFLDHSA